MKSQNYSLTFDRENTLQIQIITLERSFYIYIGTYQMSFDNLNVSFPTEKTNDNSNICLIDDSYSEIGKTLASILSSKCRKPVYLSFNLSEELFILNPLLLTQLQEQLIPLLK